MPANTPRRSIPYPVPSDPIRDYPAVARQVAELLDTELELPPGVAVGDVLTWNGTRWIPVSGVATVAPPAATTPPAIAGAANAGQTVTRTPGVWTGNPAPAVSWEWLLEGVQVQAGGDTYAIPADAAGKTLTLRETGSSSFGSSSAQVVATVNVGLRGVWRASRPFADVTNNGGSYGETAPLPFFTGNPAGTGVLERDEWGAGAVNAPLAPAPGRYRLQGHVEFPDNWNQGSSGDAGNWWQCGAGDQRKGMGQGPANSAPDFDFTFDNVQTGDPIAIYWCGGATGKGPRPNNFWMELTHLA